MRKIRPLQRQQESFFLHAAGIARQAPVRPHAAVAGDEDGDGVVAHRAAYRLASAP